MKEKTADEMLFELGYKKSEVKEFISFSKKENRYRTAKQYEICLSFCCIDKSLITKNKQYFSIEELQAINKKCQELRLDMKQWKEIKGYERAIYNK